MHCSPPVDTRSCLVGRLHHDLVHLQERRQPKQKTILTVRYTLNNNKNRQGGRQRSKRNARASVGGGAEALQNSSPVEHRRARTLCGQHTWKIHQKHFLEAARKKRAQDNYFNYCRPPFVALPQKKKKTPHGRQQVRALTPTRCIRRRVQPRSRIPVRTAPRALRWKTTSYVSPKIALLISVGVSKQPDRPLNVCHTPKRASEKATAGQKLKISNYVPLSDIMAMISDVSPTLRCASVTSAFLGLKAGGRRRIVCWGQATMYQLSDTIDRRQLKLVSVCRFYFSACCASRDLEPSRLSSFVFCCSCNKKHTHNKQYVHVPHQA